MRVLRTILGLLLLIIGLPALLIGAGFWAALQHRDPGGAFSGDLQRTVTTGYAVVVADADGLLRRDAPFARAGDTRLRLTAYTPDGPAFIGIGPADQVARYLDDVPRQLVSTVDLGTGTLPVATERVGGTRAPASVPTRESFWLKSATGGLDWHPSALRGRHYSVVIMSPSAQPGLEVTATAELSPGWLNSATWSLLVLGSLLVMSGIVVLAWPGRRREVVYVVEPSQVPDLMLAIGAPLPLSRTGGGRHAGTHRPRTLADAGTRSAQRALPSLAWPPAPSVAANAPVSPGTGDSARQVAGVSSVGAGGSSGPLAEAGVSPGGLAAAGASPGGLAGAGASPSVAAAAGASPAALAGGPGAVPPSPAEYAAATAIPGPARGTGHRPPVPGEPLSLLGGVPGKGVSPSATSPASSAVTDEAATDRPVERSGRRRPPAPASDTPVFEATAVGAWVAETAAARARETEARAAAVLAAEAAKRGTAKPEAAAVDKAGTKREPAPVAKPTVEIVKPAAGLAKPAPDVAKSATEVVKPVTEVAKPVTEVGKSATEVVKRTTGTGKSATEVAKPAAEAAKPAGEIVKPAPAGLAKPAPDATSASDGSSATGLRRAGSQQRGASSEAGPEVSPAGQSASVGVAAVVKAKSATTADVPSTSAHETGDVPPAAAKAAPAAGASVGPDQDGPAVAKPATKPAEPSAKPAKPAAEPAEPSAKPAEPAAERAEPSAKPVEQAAERAEPAAEPADAVRPSGPELTAPAPPRPTAPTRPTVPAPARPASPPRPIPDSTPSRPAAEGPAVSAPAAQAGTAAQPAAPTSSASGPTGGTALPGRPNAPVTHSKDDSFQVPVHVPISDRPAVVSQPGSSIPRETSEPPAGTAPRPVAETPRTTTEIQARLQAAMKSSTRPAGEPRGAGPTQPSAAVSSPNASAASAHPASSTDALRVGVAGRRDYPASARRDNADASRPGSTGGPISTSATGDAVSKATEKSQNHIAEQRVESPQPDQRSTEGGGSKTRRAAGKTAKADRTKPPKPEAAGPSVPGARLSAYAEEAAELLAGLSPDRRRKPDDTADSAKEARSTRKEPAKD